VLGADGRLAAADAAIDPIGYPSLTSAVPPFSTSGSSSTCIRLAERVKGVATVAHARAYAHAVESLAEVTRRRP